MLGEGTSIGNNDGIFISRLSFHGNLGIAVLNFNRPKAFNALSRKFVGEFRDALQELRYDS